MFKHFLKLTISFLTLLLLSLFVFFPLAKVIPLDLPDPQIKSAYILSGAQAPSFSCSTLPELEALSFYIYDITSQSVICQRQANLSL